MKLILTLSFLFSSAYAFAGYEVTCTEIQVAEGVAMNASFVVPYMPWNSIEKFVYSYVENGEVIYEAEATCEWKEGLSAYICKTAEQDELVDHFMLHKLWGPGTNLREFDSSNQYQMFTCQD